MRMYEGFFFTDMYEYEVIDKWLAWKSVAERTRFAIEGNPDG